MSHLTENSTIVSIPPIRTFLNYRRVKINKFKLKHITYKTIKYGNKTKPEINNLRKPKKK